MSLGDFWGLIWIKFPKFDPSEECWDCLIFLAYHQQAGSPRGGIHHPGEEVPPSRGSSLLSLTGTLT